MGFFKSALDDLLGCCLLICHQIHFDLIGDLAQLLYRGKTLEIRSDDEDFLFLLLFEKIGKFSGGGGLP